MSGELEVLGWALLHSLWQGGLVAAGLWLVLRLMPSSAVRVRYAVTLLALGALLTLPALNYGRTMALWSGHRSWVLETADGILRQELATRGRAEVSEVRAELRRRQAAKWPGAALAPAAEPGREAARVLGLLWVAAAGLLAARLIAEQRRALRLAESGSPDDGWRRSAGVVAERLGISRPVRVRVTDRLDVPALVGWRWPVVLVPRGAAALGGEEREAILAHEMAHVGRADYLANLLQSVAEALLFYSPAAWWVSARIREERECCCDRAAVETVPAGAVGYIRALLSLETGRSATRAALALHGGPLLRRIRRIHGVAREEHRGRPGRAAVLAPLLLAGCAMGAVAAFAPEVAARQSAVVLMADDIDDVRLVVVPARPPSRTSLRSMPATPAPIPSDPPTVCASLDPGARA